MENTPGGTTSTNPTNPGGTAAGARAALRTALLVTTCFVVAMGGGIVGARITAKRDRAATVAAIATAVQGMLRADPATKGRQGPTEASAGMPADLRKLRRPTPALDAGRLGEVERRLDADDTTLRLHQERLGEAESNINKISHILEQMTSGGEAIASSAKGANGAGKQPEAANGPGRWQPEDPALPPWATK